MHTFLLSCKTFLLSRLLSVSDNETLHAHGQTAGRQKDAVDELQRDYNVQPNDRCSRVIAMERDEMDSTSY